MMQKFAPADRTHSRGALLGIVAALLVLIAAPITAGSSPSAGEARIATGESEVVRSSGWLGEGEAWATEWFSAVPSDGAEGPTVLIVGGLHGNQIAGYRAADQMRAWVPTRGRLVVIPRANRRAIAANQRLTPDTPADRADLNRAFPREDDADAPEDPLAQAMWQFTSELRPDWVVCLHELASGNRLVVAPDANTAEREVAAMLAAGDRMRRAGDPEEALPEWRRGTGHVNGSLARAATEQAGATGLAVLTQSSDRRVPHRVREQRLVVHALLTSLGMITHSADVTVAPEGTPGRLQVAVFDAPGVGRSSAGSVERAVANAADIECHRIDPTELRPAILAQYDLFVAPGGSGSGQARAMGADGRAAVVNFVRNGGGYLGFCAGAYLAAANYSWSLRILDANVIDRQHWARGRGMVDLDFTDAGRDRLGLAEARHRVLYANGPLYEAAGDPAIPDFTPLAIFRSEMNRNGAPEGVMLDTPAIVAGLFGEGRVFCSSPHPEATEGLRRIVPHAMRWAAGATVPAAE